MNSLMRGGRSAQSHPRAGRPRPANATAGASKPYGGRGKVGDRAPDLELVSLGRRQGLPGLPPWSRRATQPVGELVRSLYQGDARASRAS